jgi:uncharacterized protein
VFSGHGTVYSIGPDVAFPQGKYFMRFKRQTATRRFDTTGGPGAVRGVSWLLMVLVCYTGAALSGENELVVLRRDGVAVRLQIEIADDARSRESGLMWREFLAPRTGMLFDFERARPVRMWMKNTLIPLDMLFVTESGEIVHIERNASPRSLRAIGPRRSVRYVLEINGGEAVELGFALGDRVLLNVRRGEEQLP